MANGKESWSREERLRLIQTLNALPTAQFDELVFASAVHKGNMPKDSASQGQRSQALLEWAESPIGPGLQTIDDLLSKVIAETVEIAPQFLSFVISGKISTTTTSEIHAFVRLLRKKMGDESIDVAFYGEGSIKLILSGSIEGLKAMQELNTPSKAELLTPSSVENIQMLDSDTPEARKARLILTLKVRNQKISLIPRLVRAKELVIDHARRLVSYLDLTRDLPRNLDHLTQALIYDLARDLALDTDHARDLACDVALNLTIAHDFASDLALSRDLASTLCTAFNRDLNLTHDIALALERSLTLTHDIALTLIQILTRTLQTYLNLNLANADLEGANLRNINLVGADLTDVRIKGADVEGAVFGNNRGLLESDKRVLLLRGAIFQNSLNLNEPTPPVV